MMSDQAATVVSRLCSGGPRGFSWQERFREAELADLSEAGKIGVRLAGAALAACAILYIAAGN
jgi:hypothetical protein